MISGEESIPICGILGSEGSDNAHGIDSVHDHSLDVSLYTGTAAAVTACDSKYSFHKQFRYCPLRSQKPVNSNMAPFCKIKKCSGCRSFVSSSIKTADHSNACDS